MENSELKRKNFLIKSIQDYIQAIENEINEKKFKSYDDLLLIYKRIEYIEAYILFSNDIFDENNESDKELKKELINKLKKLNEELYKRIEINK
ncbi:MAG: hypothetical protein KatS3mg096_594 [Candidatus Parcubacteria bacterium]|nr:MAG: hypothetical protein KatS3mg096_594 [Candidatus Parcubacteria bacterium]